jgi:hypothetical protein
MARKVNSTKSKRRPKSGRRKDYTRDTALALRSIEERNQSNSQNWEISRNYWRDVAAAEDRRKAKQAAHAARHGAQ